MGLNTKTCLALILLSIVGTIIFFLSTDDASSAGTECINLFPGQKLMGVSHAGNIGAQWFLTRKMKAGEEPEDYRLWSPRGNRLFLIFEHKIKEPSLEGEPLEGGR